MKTKDQAPDDQDRTREIQRQKHIERRDRDRTLGQIEDDPGRSDDIEKGKKEGGGAL